MRFLSTLCKFLFVLNFTDKLHRENKEKISLKDHCNYRSSVHHHGDWRQSHFPLLPQTVIRTGDWRSDQI